MAIAGHLTREMLEHYSHVRFLDTTGVRCSDIGRQITIRASKIADFLRPDRECQGRSKFGPLRRSKSRPVGEGVAVFVGRLERSLRSPFRAAQA